MEGERPAQKNWFLGPAWAAISSRSDLEARMRIPLEMWYIGSTYRLHKLVGYGAFGQVAIGEHVVYGLPVAIKRVPFRRHSMADLKRVLREHRILRCASSPSIVKLHDVIVYEFNEYVWEAYFVFERAATDLRQIIASSQYLNILHIKAIMFQLLAALFELHSLNVIHRDIKPANMLINADVSSRLCDFGLATVIDHREAERQPPLFVQTLQSPDRSRLSRTIAKASPNRQNNSTMQVGIRNITPINESNKRLRPSTPDTDTLRPFASSSKRIRRPTTSLDSTPESNNTNEIFHRSADAVPNELECESNAKLPLIRRCNSDSRLMVDRTAPSDELYSFLPKPSTTTKQTDSQTIPLHDSATVAQVTRARWMNTGTGISSTCETFPHQFKNINEQNKSKSSDTSVSPVTVSISNHRETFGVDNNEILLDSDPDSTAGSEGFGSQKSDLPPLQRSQSLPLKHEPSPDSDPVSRYSGMANTTHTKSTRTAAHTPNMDRLMHRLLMPKLSSRTDSLRLNEKQVPDMVERCMTPHVVTRYYRAPELILLQPYSFAVDIWSAGCILAELLSMLDTEKRPPNQRAPLFPGRSCFPLSDQNVTSSQDALDQLNVILGVIGTPSSEEIASSIRSRKSRDYLARMAHIPRIDWKKRYPTAPKEALHLLDMLLRFNPKKRPSALDCLCHPFFDDIRQDIIPSALSTSAATQLKQYYQALQQRKESEGYVDERGIGMCTICPDKRIFEDIDAKSARAKRIRCLQICNETDANHLYECLMADFAKFRVKPNNTP